MSLDEQWVPRIAGLELNALRSAEVLGDSCEKLRIAKTGTPVHDLNGSVLFVRLPLLRGRSGVGHADIAVHEALGEPLLAVAPDAPWDEPALLEQGLAAARKLGRKGRRAFKHDSVRFVAYSYPKLALQFLLQGCEVLLLELFSWAEVPPAPQEPREKMQPGQFERWSLLDEMPADLRRRRAAQYRKRVAAWQALKLARDIDLSRIAKATLLDKSAWRVRAVDQRELHYSTRNTDHAICYELRGQQTNVWCVAASVEMLLNFYRWGYTQVRLADELGLGTLAAPVGLPYSRDADVVTVIERLSSNALDATMLGVVPFTTYRTEIRANRPLISFIPGHSRTVAGYTRTVSTLVSGFTGLLVYDPWPPNAGTITRWENFNTQTYRRAYTAALRHV